MSHLYQCMKHCFVAPPPELGLRVMATKSTLTSHLFSRVKTWPTRKQRAYKVWRHLLHQNGSLLLMSLRIFSHFILIRYINCRAGKPSAGLHLDVTKNGNVVEVIFTNKFFLYKLYEFSYLALSAYIDF